MRPGSYGARRNKIPSDMTTGAPTETEALAGPPPTGAPDAVRRVPAPRRGGLLTLLRFMRRHDMLNAKYARLVVRLLHRRFLTPTGQRLKLDGLAFIGPKVVLQIGRKGEIRLGRWSWLGHGTKIRAHEGVVEIGAKTVLGQECTISSFQSVRIGRECILADRVMLIDFDHGVVEVERPIRLQGIYKRDVEVGHNCWIGYGACILRGATVGDNCIVGSSTVVTKDVPSNAVVGGVPARLLRMREEPSGMRWG